MVIFGVFNPLKEICILKLKLFEADHLNFKVIAELDARFLHAGGKQ